MATVATANPAASSPSRQVNSGFGGPIVSTCAPSRPAHATKASAAPSSVLLQRDLTRYLEVRQEHALGFLAQHAVFDHGVELEVDPDPERVEVGGADAHPTTIDDAGLGVHHFPLPFPDAHAVSEQPPIESARDHRDPR